MTNTLQRYKRGLNNFIPNVKAQHNIGLGEFETKSLIQKWKAFINRRGSRVNGQLSGYMYVDFNKRIVSKDVKVVSTPEVVPSFDQNTVLPQNTVDDIYLVTPTFTGNYVEYYDTGKIQLLIRYVKGKRNGKSLEMYPNGSVWRTFNYLNDIPTGKSVWHYPEGYLQAEVEFEDTTGKGYGTFYDFDGNVIAEGEVTENENDIIVNDIVSNNILYPNDLIDMFNKEIEKFEKDVQEDIETFFPADEEEDEVEETIKLPLSKRQPVPSVSSVSSTSSRSSTSSMSSNVSTTSNKIQPRISSMIKVPIKPEPPKPSKPAKKEPEITVSKQMNNKIAMIKKMFSK